MKIDRETLPRFLLLSFLAILIAYALVHYTINVYLVDQATVGLIHVYSWAPYLTAAITLACMFFAARKGSRRIVLLVIGVVSLCFFLLSLRITSFNANEGEISDQWPFYTSSRSTLIGWNDQPYCYELPLFSLEIRPSKFGPTLKLFRGVWPSTFPDSNVKNGFLGTVKPCST